MKEFSEEKRKRLSIASTMEELFEFSTAIVMSGQKGYPVLLIPFGCGGDDEEWVYAENPDDIEKCGKELFKQGRVLPYVHVCKHRALPR